MTESSSSNRHTQVSQRIEAPAQRVYDAFLNAEAVGAWLAPDGMRGEVHLLEPHVGGRLRMSLIYRNPDDALPGKSAEATDTFEAVFVELVPNQKIVQTVEFDSPDPAFAGEMRMTWTLTDLDGATEITLLHEGLPSGIRLEDNEDGSRQTLKNLARYVEQHR